MSSFNPDMVRALATILAETGLTEIEMMEGESRVRVARAHAPPAPVQAAPVHVPPPSVVVAQPAATPASAAAPVPAGPEAAHPGTVASPMVGVAYLSPDPDSPPFVTVGGSVSAGQTVLLIEAMKTFNQVKAPRAGTVTRILVGSGAPVEFGEPLLVIE